MATIDRTIDFGGHSRKFRSKASTAYTVGELQKLSAGDNAIIDATTGAVLVGRCEEAKGSGDTANTPLLVTTVFRGDELRATAAAGTVTNIGDPCDISSSTQLTWTNTNTDFITVVVESSSQGIVVCQRTTY